MGALAGFGVGLGAGLLSGTGLIIGGALTGVAQIGQGLYYTPSAVSASIAGKDWDNDKRQWVTYDLKAEAEQVSMR